MLTDKPSCSGEAPCSLRKSSTEINVAGTVSLTKCFALWKTSCCLVGFSPKKSARSPLSLCSRWQRDVQFMPHCPCDHFKAQSLQASCVRREDIQSALPTPVFERNFRRTFQQRSVCKNASGQMPSSPLIFAIPGRWSPWALFVPSALWR